ncbi:methyl-accepting chemotaxis protein [Paucibacter sp. DJ1R-11]|uniref:methyl-accepting chemotaxis protein n=1 Tax=Paucibacter sp. DJ1R-11 TaxID=2893556 RepID=UPI0021E47559|nr:methyl-accepting chemotaxis protein [Paucibacter sp. DJ1R-11]MCV2363153.1 methyl-accepting chemotaxis protein [Paucibacter sp. DJ1R-11]
MSRTVGFGMRARMRVFAAVLTAFTLLAMALGLQRLGALEQGMRTVYEDRVLPLKQLKRVADAYAVQVVDGAHKAAHSGRDMKQAAQDLQAARDTVNREWAAYRATQMDASELALAQEVESAMRAAEAPLLALRQLFERQALPELQTFTAQQMYPAIDPISSRIEALVELQQQVAEQEYLAAQASYRQTVQMQIGLMVAAVLVGALVAQSVVRWLTRTLGGEPELAAQVAGQIASGDLSQRIQLRAAGGVPAAQSSVIGAMAAMQTRLREVIGEIACASSSVASAAAQIAMGNQDLSERTESQSANVQQTAATMAKMTEAVQDSVKVVNEAGALARGVSDTADRSAAVVEQVVSTMQGIAQASQRIGEITSVIDGIAFQTNILALNAAVEAARAGEQGRGFAVVASEVRSLAQRATLAAREINGLIAASGEKVADGYGQVQAAGASMEGLSQQIAGVSQLIQGMGDRSSHQSRGIGEINQAIGELDAHTQKNAALVEESSAAAHGLREQAQRLNETVAYFRLQAPSARA